MPLIDLKDIHKVYEMGVEQVRALNGVDLAVERGEYVAIMGSSGSGKSTLMNLVGCLDTPSSGSYVLNGVAVQELDDSQLAGIRNKEIGFVFQTFNLLPRTSALRQVELPMLYNGRSDRRERAVRALQIVGLAERMHHKPNELSGGQQQRVAIARALVTEPALILADEPTGALDTRSGRAVLALLRATIDEGAGTLVMVTHDPSAAAWADRVVFMADGQLAGELDAPTAEQVAERLTGLGA
jgi:putative ABC transport system ATP-binding protein